MTLTTWRDDAENLMVKTWVKNCKNFFQHFPLLLLEMLPLYDRMSGLIGALSDQTEHGTLAPTPKHQNCHYP